MANMDLRTYSPDKVKIIVGPAIISGVADGTFVALEQLSDGVESEAGAYGEVSRAMNLDPRFTVTITLQQTSPSNDVFTTLFNIDRISSGDGPVDITITDLRGTTVFSGRCWVVKLATVTFSKGLEAKEWHIEAVGTLVNGGTLL